MPGLIAAIESGKYDKSLDRIIKACQERKEDRTWNLNTGDKVRFTNYVRPTSLRGRTATIVEFRRSRILVDLDDPISKNNRRFGYTRSVNQILAHASSIEPVEVS